MISKLMNFRSCSIYVILFLHLQLFHLLNTSADDASYVPIEHIVLNCGSNSSDLLSYDGRNWTGDVGSPYVSSDADTKSQIAIAPMPPPSIPQVPYMTARIFQSQFTYRFNVTPGPKFIRLFFYPASYLGLNASKSFLSVTAANFTFLHNFSASLSTDYFKSTCLVKEFIFHVTDRTLELTLTPTSTTSDAYAFVNGIEVVSMPRNLYIRGGDAPLPLVGYLPKLSFIDNNCALETMYRINVGGDDIPSKYDTGMFRTWTRDLDDFAFGVPGLEAFDMQMPVLYSAAVPAYTAPASVYRTARSMYWYKSTINLHYNLTWFFPVNSGFNYLIRLHFCEVDRDITRVNQRTFNIYLNNQTAEQEADVIAWSGRRGAPVYKDYVVMIPESSMGMQDLRLDLHPNVESKTQYYNVILNGAEIFKLSNANGNLAGLNPPESKPQSDVQVQQVTPPRKPKKIIPISVGCGVGTLVLSLLLCLLFYWFKVVRRKSMSGFCIFFYTPNPMKRAKQSSCVGHSIDEIRVATNNFDEALIVGKGGFGKVYKGSFDCGATFVAIKRGNPMSVQGASEFNTEIQYLSQLRHHNLVSLTGYCQEEGEMILVYDFMVNGTLFDHLHMKSEKPPLSWIQRLEICIGVARGLHYLHTGSGQKIIHRDIKTTNILLDHNWVAKISDFGLSKASFPSLSNTNVKGTIGYLDPEYFRCQRLSEKSDVYSFGVVLLEVLSARPALSPVEDEEHGNLADWARYCYEKGIVDELLDPNLQGKIAKESSEIYLEVAMKCLAEKAVMRPPMGDVLQNLVLALQLQKNDDLVQNRVVHKEENTGSIENSDITPGIEFSEIMMPLGR